MQLGIKKKFSSSYSFKNCHCIYTFYWESAEHVYVHFQISHPHMNKPMLSSHILYRCHESLATLISPRKNPQASQLPMDNNGRKRSYVHFRKVLSTCTYTFKSPVHMWIGPCFLEESRDVTCHQQRLWKNCQTSKLPTDHGGLYMHS